ncbi:hypothetical protein M885DRAFT_517041 [Pelagophyceae sp. CCMP2097]|nr:hypothetical protein M885DRAFT_517041 [Pelagophyceae sp. CCMP2097]
MAQSVQSSFYSAVFVPYALKPCYAGLSDAAGGRRTVFVAASLGAAAGYALCSKAKTVVPAFAAAILRAACSACAEMMLSATLADAVVGDTARAAAAGAAPRRGGAAARAQSEATSARWVGTLVGYALGLWMYACKSGRHPAHTPRARTVLLCAALFPLAGAAIGCRVLAAPRRDTGDARRPADGARRAAPRRAAALFVSVQLACVWIALKGLVAERNRDVWRAVVVALAAAVALLVAANVAAAAAPPDAGAPRAATLRALLPALKDGPARGDAALAKFVVPAVALLVLKMAPSAAVEVSNLSFYLFFSTHPCYTQYLSLLGAAASLAACLAYARCAPADARLGVLVSTPVAAAASLAGGPLAWRLRHRRLPACAGGLRLHCVPSALRGRFAYAVFSTSVDGFCAELAALAQTTLALQAAMAPAAGGGPAYDVAVYYGALLAVMDAGGAVSGWLTTPLVRALHVSYGHWGNLPRLLRTCAAASCLALVPMLAVAGRRPKRDVDAGADADADAGDGDAARRDDAGAGDDAPERRYDDASERRYDDALERWYGTPERRYDAPERRYGAPERRYDPLGSED